MAGRPGASWMRTVGLRVGGVFGRGGGLAVVGRGEGGFGRGEDGSLLELGCREGDLFVGGFGGALDHRARRMSMSCSASFWLGILGPASWSSNFIFSFDGWPLAKFSIKSSSA